MVIDTNKRAFILPHYKKEKCAKLLEALLLSQVVNITSFQKIVGKCFSFGLAIPYPGHKIVTLCCNQAISAFSKVGNPIRMTGELKKKK